MTIETANRLYELRKKNNLSQEELAEKLGVSRQAVSKWERSEASPDTDNLIALAKIYGLSLDELIYGEKEDKKEELKEESKENNANDEDVYINIDNDGDKVTIGPEGIVVEEKDGNTVKINVHGKIMEKVFKKMEDQIDDIEDELYETVYSNEKELNNGNELHIKVTRPAKFWLEFPYAVICAILYLLFGFYNVCGGWALSWIIFVTIPVYYSFVEAIYKKRFSEFAYPVFVTCVYLYLGMYHGNWHPSWLVFVTIAVYYPIAHALDRAIRS